MKSLRMLIVVVAGLCATATLARGETFERHADGATRSRRRYPPCANGDFSAISRERWCH